MSQHKKGQLSCFKAYDIRGKLGSELDQNIAYRIGRAFAEIVKPNEVVVGADIRLTSESLKQALSAGLVDSGVDVLDPGMTGSEEIYFATSYFKVDGGIEITASHNPNDYNGMKLVTKNSEPLTSSDLLRLKAIAETNKFSFVAKKGRVKKTSCVSSYVDHLLNYIKIDDLIPMKIVVNAGNGSAGPIIDAIDVEFKKNNVPIEFIKINHQPDGNFPKGVPNPMLIENRAETCNAVAEHKADLGIAWDGDFDRCFLFDETGAFIESYYIVGLLADAFLGKHPNCKIIHDPRLIWNTIDIVRKNGGVPIQSKTGHAFIKQNMRTENAVYGGEMSGHHYFKDFAYCDSGMIPWLLVIGLMSHKNIKISTMVDDRITRYPSSGEINFSINNSSEVISKIIKRYKAKAQKFENIDGLSFEFDNWRFNLRSSNTEDVIRLNVETKGDQNLLRKQIAELKQIISS